MDASRRHSSNGASTSSRTTSPSYSNPRSSPPLPQPRSVPDLHGRARRKAELNRLHQEIRLLEDELQRLDTLPPASEVCKQHDLQEFSSEGHIPTGTREALLSRRLVVCVDRLVQSIESQNDPFIGNNPGLPLWDRWFKGPPAPPSKCFCCPSRR